MKIIKVKSPEECLYRNDKEFLNCKHPKGKDVCIGFDENCPLDDADDTFPLINLLLLCDETLKASKEDSAVGRLAIITAEVLSEYLRKKPPKEDK